MNKEDLRIMLKELNKNRVNRLVNSYNLNYIKGIHRGFYVGMLVYNH